MGEIVTSVKRVTDIMGEISAASAEQSSGIEQVNATVTQMDEVTQQNAALVEEASASARALEDQAAALADAVSRFRLSAAQAAGNRAPAQRPAAARAPANDFEAMVEAHRDWKTRLQAFLRGQGDSLEADKVSRDDACKLGEWLYGPGQKYAGRAEFDDLVREHAGFHKSAGEVVRQHAKGNSEHPPAARQRGQGHHATGRWCAQVQRTDWRHAADRGSAHDGTQAAGAGHLRSAYRQVETCRGCGPGETAHRQTECQASQRRGRRHGVDGVLKPPGTPWQRWIGPGMSFGAPGPTRVWGRAQESRNG
jgi:hypothetical protein